MNLIRTLGLFAWAALCEPALAINNGTPTTAFASVGAWGVQVAPDWVLTVQHAGVNPGDGYLNGFGSRTVAARYEAPGSGAYPANDLALLRLAPASTGAPYLAINDQFIAAGSFGPLDVTIVSGQNSGPARGYGFTTVSESQVMVDPDDDGPLGPVVANYLVSFDTQIYVQGGDSGGGLFLGHVIDSGVLMGLSSAQYTDPDDDTVPIGSGFVQLAAYRSWIDATMAADSADTQVLNWVSAVPEPTTWALWAVGLGWLLRRRKPAT